MYENTIADAVQDKGDGESSLRKPLLTRKRTLINGTNLESWVSGLNQHTANVPTVLPSLSSNLRLSAIGTTMLVPKSVMKLKDSNLFGG